MCQPLDSDDTLHFVLQGYVTCHLNAVLRAMQVKIVFFGWIGTEMWGDNEDDVTKQSETEGELMLDGLGDIVKRN